MDAATDSQASRLSGERASKSGGYDPLDTNRDGVRSYQEIFDQKMNDASFDGSIAENITDIYQDLKDFLLAYRIGTVDVMKAALLECQTNFEQYWGQRLVNGLRAIHNLVYGDADLDEKPLKPLILKAENDDDEIESNDTLLKQQFRNYRGE